MPWPAEEEDRDSCVQRSAATGGGAWLPPVTFVITPLRRL